MHLPLAKAKVLIVGGPDVDARLALMHCLSDTFDLSALGSLPALRDKFLAEGFGYHAYHLKKKAQLRDELGLRPDEIVVTMISRVIRSKDVLKFVTAAQEVRRRYPQVRFLLVGPADEDSLDRLTGVELAQLKQTVIWPGPRRDIPVRSDLAWTLCTPDTMKFTLK